MDRLQAFLQEHTVEGIENILFHQRVEVAGEPPAPPEQDGPAFFLTDCRFGVVVGPELYAVCPIEKLLDGGLDGKGGFYLQAPMPDGSASPRIDAHFVGIEGRGLQQAMSGLREIFNDQRTMPIEPLAHLLKEAVSSVRAGRPGAALRMLTDGKKLDAMYVGFDLAHAVLLHQVGESRRAAMLVAEKLPVICTYALPFLLEHALVFDWYNGLLPLLPDKAEGRLGQMSALLRARCQGDSRKTQTLLGEMAAGEVPQLRLLATLALVSLFAGEGSMPLIRDCVQKLLEDPEPLLREAAQELRVLLDEPQNSSGICKEEQGPLWQFYRGHFAECIAAYEERDKEFVPQAASAEQDEDFPDLAVLLDAKEPEDASRAEDQAEVPQPLDEEEEDEPVDVTRFEDLDRDELDLGGRVYRAFAALRGENPDAQRASDLLAEYRGVTNDRMESAKPLPILDAELAALYCCTQIELNILRGDFERATLWCETAKGRIPSTLGEYAQPFASQCGHLVAFYEAWIAGNVQDMEYAVEHVPPMTCMKWLQTDLPRMVEEADNRRTSLTSAQEVHDRLGSLLEMLGSLHENEQVSEQVSSRLGEYLHKMEDLASGPELRVVVVGQSGAGKSALLNTLFRTELFKVTKEGLTGVPTEVRFAKELSIEAMDKQQIVRLSLVDGVVCSFSADAPEGDMVLAPVADADTPPAAESTASGAEGVSAAPSKPRCAPEKFLTEYICIPEVDWLDRVRVFLPASELPEGVVVVDTPGLDGDKAREACVKRELQNCHASVFVAELEQLRAHAQGLVRLGMDSRRTFFVINKMDLSLAAMGADQTVADALEARELLADALEQRNVRTYPISALSGDKLSQEARPYASGLPRLKQRLIQTARRNRDEQAARDAIRLCDMTQERFDEEYAGDDKSRTLFEEKTESDLLEYMDQRGVVLREQACQEIADQFLTIRAEFESFCRSTKPAWKLHQQARARGAELLENCAELLDSFRRSQLAELGHDLDERLDGSYREKYPNVEFKTTRRMRLLAEDAGYLSCDTEDLQKMGRILWPWRIFGLQKRLARIFVTLWGELREGMQDAFAEDWSVEDEDAYVARLQYELLKASDDYRSAARGEAGGYIAAATRRRLYNVRKAARQLDAWVRVRTPHQQGG